MFGFLVELFFQIPIALVNATRSEKEEAEIEERKRTGSGPYC